MSPAADHPRLHLSSVGSTHAGHRHQNAARSQPPKPRHTRCISAYLGVTPAVWSGSVASSEWLDPVAADLRVGSRIACLPAAFKVGGDAPLAAWDYPNRSMRAAGSRSARSIRGCRVRRDRFNTGHVWRWRWSTRSVFRSRGLRSRTPGRVRPNRGVAGHPSGVRVGIEGSGPCGRCLAAHFAFGLGPAQCWGARSRQREA